jgi:two-component system, sensor histidine kinase and response regulator
MSADPAELHSDRFEEIGQIVSSNAESIVDIWCQRAIAAHDGNDIPHLEELRNSFPEFLLSLGNSLKQRGDRLEPQRGKKASDHGRQRWQKGWSLTGVVGDYQLLRLTLLEHLDRTLSRPLELKEVLAIGSLLDEAIGKAVVTYVDYQEAYLDQAREIAEKSSLAKSHFVAKVSHEIRTPMTAILGLTELALDEPLSPQMMDFLTTVHDSAKSLLNLLNDILDLSKIEASKLELDTSDFDPWQLVEEVVRQQGIRASAKGLELILEIAHDLPKCANGDRIRLRQVLINLVSNAIKFTDQGEVFVRVRPGSCDDGRLELQVAVADTGIGISAEDQARIFAPFTQVNANTTRMFGGSGLGLAIATELVERMGGHLEVVSSLGVGSEFSFNVQLKYANGSSGPSIEAAQHIEPLRDKSLLIIDDNATHRRRLRTLLQTWGVVVEEADCGEAGIELVQERCRRGDSFQWILVDALMPGMDGFATMHALSLLSAKGQEIIAMLSVTDRSTFHDRIQDARWSGWIEKPIFDADLLAILSGRQVESARPKMVHRKEICPPLRTLSILLVEDMPANQMVVRAILQRRGHQVAIAHNGREAIDRLGKDVFDVVLMDVQMPTMDGFQATSRIRTRESQSQTRTPIIAMTASSMRGDAEKCLAAGMDAYISKPIDSKQLIELVESVATMDALGPPGRDLGDSVTMQEGKYHPHAMAANDPSNQPIGKIADFARALTRLGGERALLHELIGFFETDGPELVAAFEAAMAQHDRGSASRAAHSLKGLAASFDAERCQQIARFLEQEATAGAWDICQEQMPQLKRDVTELIAELKKFQP